MKKAFTLLEICIVVIIVGMLSAIGINHSIGMRELELDREVAPTLTMIAFAERNFSGEDYLNRFYPASANLAWPLTGPLTVNNRALINTNLNLAISEAPNAPWLYTVRSYNNLNPRIFCLRADRNGGNGRFFTMLSTQTQPVQNVACP
ncbi:MAG TPA: prepilin-type N-terminal cleavage/methylation domain-containing protein [Candidatus Omnitrophota bacterium]|nr:prepilin-type N-terminal cleavage/methylation domain-containing protein [Candidatus Omnitrophota bacterium]HPT06525.1 prepilin-type N-terminal cleavage/methylation domain-containing protein [Candidatus Omnitrophota bacterium]